jgi:hypothetical protein
MATVFKNVLLSGLGTSPTTVLTSNGSATTTVIGMSLSNTTPDIVQLNIQIQDTVASTSAYYVYGLTIPPNSSARVVSGGEKLNLGPLTNVIMTSNTASSLDLVMSWVEIS